ncbi:hypothetical protein [Nocardia otitidiscaviarum]|uniref:hypothetical protein n=1 Tax=Nocardia otitidiscaviarum TaxID=1823 RepID=UPI0018933BB4|nr:hypothetical protein [Nocardia otitidiscaviarum]MBF6183524.1 hypothetical protein [Nocardia otitidiscaviarum]
MTLKADLDILGKLSTTVQGLARDVDGIKMENPPNPDADSPLQSVNAAGRMSVEVVYGGLVASAKQRLNEISAVMAECVTQFQSTEDENAAALAAAYKGGTAGFVAEVPGQ